MIQHLIWSMPRLRMCFQENPLMSAMTVTPAICVFTCFSPVMIVMAMTINLSGDELKENIGRGVKLFNRQDVRVPLAFW